MKLNGQRGKGWIDPPAKRHQWAGSERWGKKKGKEERSLRRKRKEERGGRVLARSLGRENQEKGEVVIRIGGRGGKKMLAWELGVLK